MLYRCIYVEPSMSLKYKITTKNNNTKISECRVLGCLPIAMCEVWKANEKTFKFLKTIGPLHVMRVHRPMRKTAPSISLILIYTVFHKKTTPYLIAHNFRKC